jgi:hypothetical protein
MEDANNSYKIVSADDMGLPVDLLRYLDTHIKKLWTGVYSSWTYIVDNGDERRKFYARMKSAYPLLKKAYEEKGWDLKVEFDDWSNRGKISFMVSKLKKEKTALRRREEALMPERHKIAEKQEQEELQEEKIVAQIRPNALILIARIICDFKQKDDGNIVMRNFIQKDEMAQLRINITSEESDTTYAQKARLFARRFSLLTKSSFYPIEINHDGFRLACVTLDKGLKGRIVAKLKKNIEEFVENKKSAEYRKILFKTQINYIGSPVTYKLYYSLLLLEALQKPDAESAYGKVEYPLDRLVPKSEISKVISKLNNYFNSKYNNFDLLDSNEQAFTFLCKNNLLGDGAYLYFKEN